MLHRFLLSWFCAGAIVAILAPASTAFAYCRTTTCAAPNAPAHCARDPLTGCYGFGAPLFWEQSCASYSVDERGSPKLGLGYAEAEALVASAFAAWPTADCAPGFPSIAVLSFGPTSCARAEFNPEGPNANAVIFQDVEWPHGDPTQIGLTAVTFDTDSGKILGADIEINTFDHSLTPDQARIALTHEAGHFLGLDHSSEPSALMWKSYDLQVPEAVLTPDDVTAICAAYPSTRYQPVCDPEPERGYAADCGGDLEGSCAFEPHHTNFGASAVIAFLVAAFGLARWRARSRPTNVG
jgi:hypothetical protein